MELLLKDKEKKKILAKQELKFSSFSAFHLLSIRLRTKKSISIKINKQTLASIAGTDKQQIVYLLIFLKGQIHTLSLDSKSRENIASLESVMVYSLNLDQLLSLNVKDQAEDGERRPWITFILYNLPLASLTHSVTYSRRKRDSDDIKIIIDGNIQRNIAKTIKHFLWRYAGSLLPWISPTKTEEETLIVGLPPQLHKIEFWADRMPTINRLTINFGTTPSFPKNVPTVDNPKWTGNFYDDTEEILLARAIYGEMGGETLEAKTAVGWTIRNRVEDNQKRWGKTYHDVILAKYQYEPFNDPESKIFKKITNPPFENPLEKNAWEDSYNTVITVILNKNPDPTSGANHFYSTNSPQKPSWATDDKFIIQIGATRFYKI